MKIGVILLFTISFILISSSFTSAALGLSPARRDVNFEPNSKYVVTYSAYSDRVDNVISISAAGDLAEYVTFDKTTLTGGGQFTATLTLPSSIDTPGKNVVYITVTETPQRSFIGTAIVLRAVIVVFVPYPGKYIEAELKAPDANIGEQIPVELKITNRGTDSILVSPVINFYDSSGNAVDSMTFVSERLNTSEETSFGKYLDSSDLKPDNYLAQAIIDYGASEEFVLNKSLRIGNLNVAVVNFTQNATVGEINKFAIRVKSNWNGKIEGAYADVNVSDGYSSYAFGTSPQNLAPFEEKEIFGYFDAKGVKAGNYQLGITLNYEGQSTYASGELILIKKGISIWVVYGGIAAILVVLAAIVIYLLMRYKKGSRKAGRRR